MHATSLRATVFERLRIAIRQTAVCMLLATVAPAAFAQSPNGLVAAYGFNEGQGTTVADASPNKLSGTASSATWVPGRFGNALQFTGANNSRVTIASNALLQLSGAFTLSAWVYPQSSQTAEPTVIAKEIPGNLSYVLYSRGAGVGPNAYSYVNGSYALAASPSTIPANTWTFIAATYDGNALSVYVNGSLVASSPVGGSLTSGTGALRIGSNAVFSGEGFAGRIDEVRVYNRALSMVEIQSDMNSPVGSAAPPPDTTPPAGSVIINAGAATTAQTAVTLTLAATDNASGVVDMRFSNDGASYSAPATYTTSVAWALSSGDGVKTVYAQFRDGAGNWSSPVTDTILLATPPPPDTTPPTGTVQINGGANLTTQVAVTLSLSATDNASGVTQMRFSNDGGSYSAPIAFAASAPWVLTTGDGTKTVFAQFLDGAGNWSMAATDTIDLVTAPPPDTVPPTGTVVINGNAAITAQSLVTLTLSAFDDASGVVQMRFSNDGVNYAAATAYATSATWTVGGGDGTKTVHAQFRDGTGNWSGGTSDSILLDGTPPTGTLQINGGAPTSSQTAVTLSLSASDNLTGVVDMRLSNDGISFGPSLAFAASSAWSLSAGDGTKTVHVQFRDGAGNWSTPVTATIVLDATPPAGSVQINAGAVYSTQAGVSLMLAASDATSGVAQMRLSNDGVNYAAPLAFASSAPWTLSTGDGSKTVYAQFRDGAGNWSAPASASIVLDSTAPAGSLQVNGGAASTSLAAVTLTLSATDNTSGVSQMRFSNDGVSYAAAVTYATSAGWTLTAGDGVKTVYAQFRDGAGNWSNAVATTITLTTTPPPDVTPPMGTISINGGAATTGQQAVTLTLSATDNATGVTQMRFSNDGVSYATAIAYASSTGWTLTSGDGVKTVFAQFRDGAGNWSNATTSSITLIGSSALVPQLAAFELYSQNEGVGTNPAITPAITTQTDGSTLIALGMGWIQNFSAPIDSYGNAWSLLSGPNLYYSPEFFTAIWVVPSAVGGPGHTLRFNKQAYPGGEVSMAMIEVLRAGAVDLVYRWAPASSPSPGSITTTGPATLIAVWGGDSSALDHAAVPDNGFTVIDSYLDFGTNGESGIQVAIAVKDVAAAGTYTVNWTSTPSQGCACYLLAVRNPSQSPPSDTTPPSGSVQINGGAASTSQTAVTLMLAATDNATGVTQMRFSNDGTAYSSPISYAATAGWALTSGNGLKTVFAQFRDGAGNWSNAATATITLATAPPPDTTPPTGTIAINGGVATTSQQAVTLTLSATDNASGVSQMRFSNDGVSYAAAVTYATSAGWTLTAGDGVKTVYAQFRDGAGNWSNAVATTITLTTTPPPDVTPPMGTISINGGAATTGQQAVTLTLSATDNATGVTQMRFSNDGVSYATAIAYASSTGWTLTSGDGVKTVFAQFRDGAGNWSAVTNDTITLATSTQPGGLVLALGFNEGTGSTTADASGNGLSGAVSNSTWVAGKFGTAIKFKATSTSRVTVAATPLLQMSGAFTMAAWVNPAVSQVAEPTVMAKEVPGNLAYVLYASGSGGIGPNAYVLAGGSYQHADAPTAIPANAWSHVASTYDGATLSVYVNGVLVRAAAVAGALNTGSGALRIGNNAVFGGEGFNGTVDEVRIYSRALSAAEIQAIMTIPVGP